MEILLYFGNEIYRYAVEIASLSDRSEENHIYHIYTQVVRGFSLNETYDHDVNYCVVILMCGYRSTKIASRVPCQIQSVDKCFNTNLKHLFFMHLHILKE